MNALSPAALAAYWSANEVAVNIVVFMNLLGALLLGLIVGYERSYHGRAAGMRTYGLVCMASAGLTVIVGFPESWYGGHAMPLLDGADPTRVIQGIVTGIGFLGAGLIMRDGHSISGLTSAASIWAASAIGILVGVGFYAAAMLLTVLSAASMMWVSRLESRLPSRPGLAISLRFRRGFVPREDVLRRTAAERGYDIAGSTLTIRYDAGAQQWEFIAVARGHEAMATSRLAGELASFEGVEHFSIAHARN